MDPEACYAQMMDLRNDLEERARYALDLLVWLAKGGWAPGDGSAVVALEAAIVIIGYIESLA